MPIELVNRIRPVLSRKTRFRMFMDSPRGEFSVALVLTPIALVALVSLGFFISGLAHHYGTQTVFSGAVCVVNIVLLLALMRKNGIL